MGALHKFEGGICIVCGEVRSTGIVEAKQETVKVSAYPESRQDTVKVSAFPESRPSRRSIGRAKQDELVVPADPESRGKEWLQLEQTAALKVWVRAPESRKTKVNDI
jgi:hypothetical protein